MECCLDSILHPLCPSRSSFQYCPQSMASFYLYTSNYGCMGNRYDIDGTCQQLWWTYCSSVLLRCGRGKIFISCLDGSDNNKNSQSGLFPGATYLMTLWYLRYEVQTRMVIFYSGATLSGAFSGLLAFAIQKMDGIGGKRGWAWYALPHYILLGFSLTVITIGSSSSKGCWPSFWQSSCIFIFLMIQLLLNFSLKTRENLLLAEFK